MLSLLTNGFFFQFQVAIANLCSLMQTLIVPKVMNLRWLVYNLHLYHVVFFSLGLYLVKQNCFKIVGTKIDLNTWLNRYLE